MAALAIAAALYALWVLFLASMALIRARQAGMLTRAATALGLPVIILTGTIDVLVNWVIGTLIFLDRPREWTLSQRLSRLCAGGGWRGTLACWTCSNLLDQFDPTGKHCRH